MSKERYTVGRLPDNDIRIDNPAVSGHHALVINILNDSFLEDLNSTNGTYVNGKIIKKHALQHGDVITVGHHALRFVDSEGEEPEDEFEKTMVISPRDAAALMAGSPKAAAAMQPPPSNGHGAAGERRRVALVPERRAAAREAAGAVRPVRGPRARTREDAHHARPAGRAGGRHHASRRRLLHRARRERQGRRLPARQRRRRSGRRRAGCTTTTSCSSRASRWDSSKADLPTSPASAGEVVQRRGSALRRARLVPQPISSGTRWLTPQSRSYAIAPACAATSSTGISLPHSTTGSPTRHGRQVRHVDRDHVHRHAADERRATAADLHRRARRCCCAGSRRRSPPPPPPCACRALRVHEPP